MPPTDAVNVPVWPSVMLPGPLIDTVRVAGVPVSSTVMVTLAVAVCPPRVTVTVRVRELLALTWLVRKNTLDTVAPLVIAPAPLMLHW